MSARWERSVGQAGASVSPVRSASACASILSMPRGADQVLGAGGDGVVVAGGQVAEQLVRVGLLAQRGGRGDRRAVAAQHLGDPVERGRRDQCLGPDQVVRVAVAGDVEIKVVGELAAGERDVEQVAVFVAGEHDVAGAGGDALGAVDGGGVAELDRLGDVVGGQGDGLAELVVDHGAGSRRR